MARIATASQIFARQIRTTYAARPGSTWEYFEVGPPVQGKSRLTAYFKADGPRRGDSLTTFVALDQLQQFLDTPLHLRGKTFQELLHANGGN